MIICLILSTLMTNFPSHCLSSHVIIKQTSDLPAKNIHYGLSINSGYGSRRHSIFSPLGSFVLHWVLTMNDQCDPELRPKILLLDSMVWSYPYRWGCETNNKLCYSVAMTIVCLLKLDSALYLYNTQCFCKILECLFFKKYKKYFEKWNTEFLIKILN